MLYNSDSLILLLFFIFYFKRVIYNSLEISETEGFG